jgi:hypothetical protein
MQNPELRDRMTNMDTNEIEPFGDETAEPVQTDPSAEEALALFGDVADRAYEDIEPMAPMAPPEGGVEVEEGSPWADLIGPEIVDLVKAEVAAAMASVQAEVAKQVRAELQRAFEPIRAHRDALQAKLLAEKAAREEAEFASTAPRYAEPGIKAMVSEAMGKYPGMDRSTAYRLSIAMVPSNDIAVVEGTMPGMGSPMALPSVPSSVKSVASHFNRNRS